MTCADIRRELTSGENVCSVDVLWTLAGCPGWSRQFLEKPVPKEVREAIEQSGVVRIFPLRMSKREHLVHDAQQDDELPMCSLAVLSGESGEDVRHVRRDAIGVRNRGGGNRRVREESVIVCLEEEVDATPGARILGDPVAQRLPGRVGDSIELDRDSDHLRLYEGFLQKMNSVALGFEILVERRAGGARSSRDLLDRHRAKAVP